jgi:hypothetical protein
LVLGKFCNRVKKIFKTFTDNGFLKIEVYYNMGMKFGEVTPKTISTIGVILFNMKIIDYDVSKRIPPISESDIDTKIIISHKTFSNKNIFIDYMIHDFGVIFRFRGNMKIHATNEWLIDTITWSDNYNNGETIMDLLLKEQAEMEKRDWQTIYYIVESLDDLITIINTFNITGNYYNELIDRWNTISSNQKA